MSCGVYSSWKNTDPGTGDRTQVRREQGSRSACGRRQHAPWLRAGCALGEGAGGPHSAGPPQATREAGVTPPPGAAAGPAGPRPPWRVSTGHPIACQRIGTGSVRESRVCGGAGRPALSAWTPSRRPVHPAGTHTGHAQCGRVGGLLEAPHSRPEPRLNFQLRLLGTVPPPAVRHRAR